MDSEPIIIDAGSTMIRAGFAGQDHFDLLTFSPTTVDNRTSIINTASQHSIIDPVDPTPFKTKGVVTNWDQMENLWYHAYYNSLEVDPTERVVVHPMSPLSTNADRAKVAEISLEAFNMVGCYMMTENVVSAYYKGTTNSLSVMINEETINIVPLIDGRVIAEGQISLPFGGKTVSQHLLTTLNNTQGCAFTHSTRDLKVGRDMKEKLCFFGNDTDPEAGERSYELPDGQVITLNEERTSCYNALFDPTLFGLDNNQISLHAAIHQAINRCAIHDRRNLYNAINISGGTANVDTLGPHLTTLLKSTLKQSSSEEYCRRESAPNRQMRICLGIPHPGLEHLCCWLGGSILGSLTSMSDHWVLKAEWEEFGESCVLRKCPL